MVSKRDLLPALAAQEFRASATLFKKKSHFCLHAGGRGKDGVATVTQPFPLKTQGNLKNVLAGDLPSVRIVFIQGCAWKLSSFFYA